MSTTDDDTPEAVAKHIDNVVTGAVERAERRGRKYGEHTGRTPQVVPVSTMEHVREIAEKVFDEKIPAHKLDCMQPGGGLHELGKKVDQLRVTDIKGKLIMSAILVLIPIALALWNNSKSNDRLQDQIKTAAEVAKQLKVVQDVAKSHPASFESADVPMTKAVPK